MERMTLGIFFRSKRVVGSLMVSSFYDLPSLFSIKTSTFSCKGSCFLIKGIYAGATEGIEESNQNGDQDPDPSGSQIITVRTGPYSACDDRRDVPFDPRDK